MSRIPGTDLSGDIRINGFRLNEIDDTGCFFFITDIGGWWSLPEVSSAQVDRGPLVDGIYGFPGKFTSRDLELTGYVIPPNFPRDQHPNDLVGVTDPKKIRDWRISEARRALNKAAALVREQALIEVDESGAPKVALVRLVDTPNTAYDNNKGILRFTFPLRAQDPRKYGLIEDTTTVEQPDTVGRTYTRTYNRIYANSSLIAEINNVGDYNTKAVIAIKGPITNPAIVSSTGGAVKMTGTIVGSDTVYVDLDSRGIDMSQATGSTVFVDPDTQWFDLQPGITSLRLTGQLYDVTPTLSRRRNLFETPNFFITTGDAFTRTNYSPLSEGYAFHAEQPTVQRMFYRMKAAPSITDQYQGAAAFAGCVFGMPFGAPTLGYANTVTGVAQDYSPSTLGSTGKALATVNTDGVIYAAPKSFNRVARTNLQTDPRATNTGFWSGSFGGATGTETAVTGASDGPTLPDGSRPTTYMRYTWTSGVTKTTPVFMGGSNIHNTGAFPLVNKGDLVAGSIYIRPSIPIRAAVLLDTFLGTVNGPDYNLSALITIPAGTWTRITGLSGAIQDFDKAQILARFDADTSFVTGTTIDVTCAMLEAPAVAVSPYFDGSMAATNTFSYGWTGAANTSFSVMRDRGGFLTVSPHAIGYQNRKRNFVVNPRAVSGMTLGNGGWQGPGLAGTNAGIFAGGAHVDIENGPMLEDGTQISTALRAEVISAGSTILFMGTGRVSSTSYMFRPGTPIGGSMWFYSTRPLDGRLAIIPQGTDGSPREVANHVSDVVLIPANTWTKVSGIGTLSISASSLNTVRFITSRQTWDVGDFVMATGAAVDAGYHVVEAPDAFDGYSRNYSAMQHVWEGEPLHSPSVQYVNTGTAGHNLIPSLEGRLGATLSVSRGTGSSDTETVETVGGPDGGVWYKSVLTAVGSVSRHVAVLARRDRVPVQAGKTYTVSGWHYTSRTTPYPHRIYVSVFDSPTSSTTLKGYGATHQGNASAGWNHLTQTFTPSIDGFIAIGLDYTPLLSEMAAGDVWGVAGLQVEEGHSYTGWTPYGEDVEVAVNTYGINLSTVGGNEPYNSVVADGLGGIWAIPFSANVITKINSLNNTAVTGVFNAELTTAGNKYSSGVLAPNGKIYCAPNVAAGDILVIDPVTESASNKSYGLTITPNDIFWGSTATRTGFVVFAPHGSTDHLIVINTTTETAVQLFDEDLGLPFGTLAQTSFGSAVSTDTGIVYLIPSEGSSHPVWLDTTTWQAGILKFDVDAATADNSYWLASVDSGNGQILGVPRGSTADWLSIATTANGSTQTFDYVPTAGSAKHTTAIRTGTGWTGSVEAPTGAVVAVPGDSDDFMMLLPNGDTIRTPITAELGVKHKYDGAVLGADLNVYGIPYNASGILTISLGAGNLDSSGWGVNLSGEGKWIGGALGADNKIYAAPHNADDILILDTVTRTALRSQLGSSFSGAGKWAGAVASGKYVFFAPYNANTVLIVDTEAGTAMQTNFGLNLSGSAKWWGGAASTGGIVYLAPHNADQVLVIDPSAMTASLQTFGISFAGNQLFRDAYTASDGKVYLVPDYSLNVIVIDPVSGTATQRPVPGGGTSATRWSTFSQINSNTLLGIPYRGGEIMEVTLSGSDTAIHDWAVTLAPEDFMDAPIIDIGNKIYYIPINSAFALVHDKTTQTTTRTTFGLNLTATNKWRSAVYLPDQAKIVAIPADATHFMIIDTTTDTATQTTMGLSVGVMSGTNKWAGGAYSDPTRGGNGHIYVAPADSIHALFINTTTMTATVNGATTTPAINKFSGVVIDYTANRAVMVPYNFQFFGMWNMSIHTASFTSTLGLSSDVLNETEKWSGGRWTAASGRIVLVPHNSSHFVSVVSSVAQARIENFGLDRYEGFQWKAEPAHVGGPTDLLFAPTKAPAYLRIVDEGGGSYHVAPLAIPNLVSTGGVTSHPFETSVFTTGDYSIYGYRVDEEPSVFITDTAGNSWSGVVLGTGWTYGVPLNNSQWIRISPAADGSVVTLADTGILSLFPFSEGVLGANGRIYGIPYNAQTILAIDPTTNTIVNSAFGGNTSGVSSWTGGVLASDGNIYGIPGDREDILIIDTNASTAVARNDTTSRLIGNDKWSDGVLGADGNIYGVPYNSSDILIITPGTPGAVRTSMGLTITGAQNWSGGVLYIDDKIYCAPDTAASILVIDTSTSIASLTDPPSLQEIDLGVRFSYDPINMELEKIEPDLTVKTGKRARAVPLPTRGSEYLQFNNNRALYSSYSMMAAPDDVPRRLFELPVQRAALAGRISAFVSGRANLEDMFAIEIVDTFGVSTTTKPVVSSLGNWSKLTMSLPEIPLSRAYVILMPSTDQSIGIYRVVRTFLGKTPGYGQLSANEVYPEYSNFLQSAEPHQVDSTTFSLITTGVLGVHPNDNDRARSSALNAAIGINSLRVDAITRVGVNLAGGKTYRLSMAVTQPHNTVADGQLGLISDTLRLPGSSYLPLGRLDELTEVGGRFYTQFVVPATWNSAAWLALPGGTNGSIWYDGVVIEEIDSLDAPAIEVTYFDGNTEKGSWEGAPDNSISNQAPRQGSPRASLTVTYRSAWIS